MSGPEPESSEEVMSAATIKVPLTTRVLVTVGFQVGSPEEPPFFGFHRRRESFVAGCARRSW